MKKYKNLLLLSIVSICSFLLVGVGTVKAGVGYANSKPICDPSSAASNLKGGDKTKCYIVGTGSQANGTTHGFMVRMYTTDGLEFDSVESTISGTRARAVLATAASDQTETDTLSDGTQVSFSCRYDASLKAENPDWQITSGDEFRCGFFYSDSKEGKITVQNAGPSTSIQPLISAGNGTMVIGVVNAHIGEQAKNSSQCGELCVFAKEADQYTSYAGLTEGTDTYRCAEVHYTTEFVQNDTPDTGAFASYSLLAAGALIAISAVAIAKKHNKIYKV